MSSFPAKMVQPGGKLTIAKAAKRVTWGSVWKIPEKTSMEKVKVSSISENEAAKDNIFIRYCDNTSVHGIRYLSHQGLHWTERLAWGIIVSLATFGTVHVSILLSQRYQTSPLSTVVENTNFHVSEIPYPAIGICNSHRINSEKVNDVLKRYLPNATKEDLVTFGLLLDALDVLDFGSFEEFDSFKHRNVTGLMGIDITKLVIELRYTCQDLFEKCWWRTKPISCCEIFKMQKSEYGICYSFNSASNEENPLDYDNKLELWRTTSYNEWSGFRGLLKTYQGRVRRYTYPVGILVIVHHPYEWPQQAKFIPEGTGISIGIQPTAFYASSDVRRLPSTERQCIYKEEATSNPLEIMNLQTLPYLRANCMAECRQRAMMFYCNCTLDFFYPSDIFNYEKPPIENEYFDVNEEGIMCPCLPECSRTDYSVELFQNLGIETASNSVALDIHFKSSTMLRYRTDVTFGWLDLMVAFGGIAGLFLGCSLLSGAELVYYLTIGLFWHNTNPQQHHPSKHTQRTRPRINTISHRIEHVQQQWRLAKGNMFIVEATHIPPTK